MINVPAYQALRPTEARVRVELAAQKAKLLNRQGEVVIETDISSGKTGHETPMGRFRIMEKLENKRSNRYGRYLHPESLQEIGFSWEMEKPPKGAIYEGFEMPYWMRLTKAGIGMHVGYVEPDKALSFGCIRFPKDVQPMFFEKCLVGTRVDVVQGQPRPPMVTPAPPPKQKQGLIMPPWRSPIRQANPAGGTT